MYAINQLYYLEKIMSFISIYDTFIVLDFLNRKKIKKNYKTTLIYCKAFSAQLNNNTL